MNLCLKRRENSVVTKLNLNLKTGIFTFLVAVRDTEKVFLYKLISVPVVIVALSSLKFPAIHHSAGALLHKKIIRIQMY